jgi:hypothetical protein
MIIDSIGLPGTDYHSLQEWGMDVLKVGNSLGSGSVAILKDSILYKISNTKESKFRLISDGPVRAIFQIIHSGCSAGNTLFDIEETICIWAGQYGYENKVVIRNGNGSDIKIATGIVNLKNKSDELTQSKKEKVRYLASHCVQSENNDFLGMAILTDENYFKAYYRTPETGNDSIISNTDCLIIQQEQNTASYFFMAGWELSQDTFTSKEEFLELVEKEAIRKSFPVKVR